MNIPNHPQPPPRPLPPQPAPPTKERALAILERYKTEEETTRPRQEGDPPVREVFRVARFMMRHVPQDVVSQM